VLRSINRDSTTVALAASDCSGAVIEVNAGSAEQARSLEQVREAIRQSAASITKVSGDARNAAAAAEEATGLVNRGQIVIEGLAELMETIARNSREVAEATQSLGQIAAKTDILATAAAVEAARVGEHGRGFAVIGQQVGQLAERSAVLSAQIARLVDSAGRDTQSGLAAAGSAKQVVDDINKQVQSTDALIRSIAEAMLAQQSAVVELDATADSLAIIGEHNVQAGEQISMRLTQLRDMAAATQAAVARFKTD
jgi:methyl-accepting chemotaxis protein